MAGNRKQRRQKGKGKPQGVTYADMMARKKFQMEACKQAVTDTAVQIQSEINTQRALWMACVAMNRAFGIGKKRFYRFATELDQVAAWYTEMRENVDDVYANEKLRRLASKCSGIEVSPLYDKEMAEAIRRHQEDPALRDEVTT